IYLKSIVWGTGTLAYPLYRIRLVGVASFLPKALSPPYRSALNRRRAMQEWTKKMNIEPAKPKWAASSFTWNDPFLLDYQLTDEERLIRDAGASLAADKLARRVEKAYLEEKSDPAIFREMGEAGLLGVTIPEEYGSVGAGYVSYGLVAREVERIDSGYRSMMSVQSSLVMHPIYAYGTEEQRKKYLPKLASGEWIGCFRSEEHT